jgi:hypothetical protein
MKNKKILENKGGQATQTRPLERSACINRSRSSYEKQRMPRKEKDVQEVFASSVKWMSFHGKPVEKDSRWLSSASQWCLNQGVRNHAE